MQNLTKINFQFIPFGIKPIYQTVIFRCMWCVKLFPNGVKTINFAISSLFKTCLQQKTERRKINRSPNHPQIPHLLLGWSSFIPGSHSLWGTNHQHTVHCVAHPLPCIKKVSCHHGKKNSYALILNIGKGTEVCSCVLLYSCWSDCINIFPLPRFHLWHSFILERAAAHCWLVLEGPRLPDSLYFHQMAITFNALVIHNEGLCKRKWIVAI